MTRRWLVYTLTLTAVALAASLYVWFVEYDRLPAQVPIHWDIHLEPDSFVPREGALLYLLLGPMLLAGLIVLALVLPWLSPRRFEVDRFRGVYNYVFALAVTLFTYLHFVMLWVILDGGAWPGRLFVAGFFLFFALLGNVLGQVQRNFWVGVRTPWTLASEAVWVRTHRVAAWLFVAVGVAGFVAVLAGVPLWVCFVLLMLGVLATVVYSLVLYKRLEREGRA
jgi:uncharacterized membrane protein